MLKVLPSSNPPRKAYQRWLFPRRAPLEPLAATSKGKLVASGDTVAVHPPLLLDVHIEEVGEELSSPATRPEVGINQPEKRLPVEGQLLLMFADLQKQLVEQRAETIYEREQAALERDATTVSRISSSPD